MWKGQKVKARSNITTLNRRCRDRKKERLKGNRVRGKWIEELRRESEGESARRRFKDKENGG